MTEPPIIPGEVVRISDAITATQVMDPISMAAHKFGNTLRHLILNTHGVFKTEGAMRDALDAITAFETHLIPPRDRNLVRSDTDMAPVEDVTKRVPPRGATPPQPPGPAIDYAALAQALIAAQEANNPAPVTEEETPSEPARDDSTN